MRVKMGERIRLCTLATHTSGSKLLLLTTPNGVYTVDCIVVRDAEVNFHKLLYEGYLDISKYEYSN